jgi:alpha-1,6-mannosyltransferase
MNKYSTRLTVAAVLFLSFIITTIRFLPSHTIVIYTITWIASSIIFLLVCYFLFRSTLSNKTLFALLSVLFLVRISFLSMTPIGSDDVYRYLWDGKVQSFGIDPYQFAPNDSMLRSFHTTLLPAAVNHPEMKTIYFPVTQWVFHLAYLISREQVWGFKLLILIAELSTIIGILLLLRHLRQPLQLSLLYAACPLPIYQFALDAHVDALGIPFLIFGLVFYLKGRKNISLILIAVASSVKPVPLLLLPILFLIEKDIRSRLKVLFIPLCVFAVHFIPYIADRYLFEALLTFTKHWTFNGAIFTVVMMMFNDNQTARIICALLLIASLCLLYLSRKGLFDTFFYAVLLLLLFSPVVHPWYVVWLAALIPFTQRWSGIIFTAVVSLTGFTFISFQLVGVWREYPIVILIEYLPVIGLLFYELMNLNRLNVQKFERF